jgi:peroxiredoxin
MKKLIASFLLLPTLLITTSCTMTPAEPEKSPSSNRVDMPDFTLRDLSNREVSLNDFKGKSPVLLFFWATWCPYCQKSLPAMISLREKYSDQDLAILGIDLDEPRDLVQDYIDKFNVNFTILIDERNVVSSQMGIVGVPTFILVDKEGKGVVADNSLSPAMSQMIKNLTSS